MSALPLSLCSWFSPVGCDRCHSFVCQMTLGTRQPAKETGDGQQETAPTEQRETRRQRRYVRTTVGEGEQSGAVAQEEHLSFYTRNLMIAHTARICTGPFSIAELPTTLTWSAGGTHLESTMNTRTANTKRVFKVTPSVAQASGQPTRAHNFHSS